jgi:DNA-binding phage protein
MTISYKEWVNISSNVRYDADVHTQVYLNEVLAYEPDKFINALRHVVNDKMGVYGTLRECGIDGKSIDDMLRNTNPTLRSLLKVLKHLGIQLQITTRIDNSQ